MADDAKNEPVGPEPDTESSEHLDEEVPTEEQEQAATDTQASELATVEVLAQEVEELRARAAERDDFLDRLQRSKAEFSNYQKRQERDRERSSDEARRAFALGILPALDDLDLALAAAQPSAAQPPAGLEPAGGSILKGVELIRGKLLAALREGGIVPYDSLGKPYDPAFHEAVVQLEKADVPDRTVLEELRRGYLQGDRVLRAARVAVSKGGPKPPPAQ